MDFAYDTSACFEMIAKPAHGFQPDGEPGNAQPPGYAYCREYELLHSPFATTHPLCDYNEIKCIGELRQKLTWII